MMSEAATGEDQQHDERAAWGRQASVAAADSSPAPPHVVGIVTFAPGRPASARRYSVWLLQAS